MKNTAKKAVFVTIMTILTSACSGDNSDLVSYINEIKSKKGAPIEPIPKFAPLPTFRFPEHDDRRSPFKPVQHQRVEQLAPDQKRVRQPLEAYPLDALKFVGILKEGKVLWGLIKDPDKKVVPVKVGSYMGSNYGRIISIKNNEIKLEELVKDSGSWAKRITTINYDTGKQE